MEKRHNCHVSFYSERIPINSAYWKTVGTAGKKLDKKHYVTLKKRRKCFKNEVVSLPKNVISVLQM